METIIKTIKEVSEIEKNVKILKSTTIMKLLEFLKKNNGKYIFMKDKNYILYSERDSGSGWTLEYKVGAITYSNENGQPHIKCALTQYGCDEVTKKNVNDLPCWLYRRLNPNDERDLEKIWGIATHIVEKGYEL